MRHLGTVALVTVAAAVAGSAGYGVAMVRCAPLATGWQEALCGQADSDAYLRYRLSPYSKAKDALLAHAKLASALASDAATDRFAYQAFLSYGRLAVLAERESATEDALRYFRLASEQVLRHGEQTTPADVKRMVLEFDRTWDVADRATPP